MANMNVEVSDKLIDNLKNLGYEIVRIGNPKNGEMFLSSCTNDNNICANSIMVSNHDAHHSLRVIVRKILKWPPFLGDKCDAFKLVSKDDPSPSHVNIYDEFGGFDIVRVPMLSYDFREYPIGVKITRKDCAT